MKMPEGDVQKGTASGEALRQGRAQVSESNQKEEERRGRCRDIGDMGWYPQCSVRALNDF